MRSGNVLGFYYYLLSTRYKLDPLFFYNITVPLLEQLRSKSHQSEYLGALPINCVVQAFHGYLAALGSYMRNTENASLSFVEFQAGAMATMDLKPRETVMCAYTAIHCQELFVVQQFSRSDGKSVSAPTVPTISYPPQFCKRPLPQSGPPPFRQRTSLISAVPRAQPGRPAPIVARLPHLGGNNPVPHADPPPPVGPLSISMSRTLCQRSTESAIPSDARLRIVLVAVSGFPRSVNLPQWTRQSCFSLCRV